MTAIVEGLRHRLKTASTQAEQMVDIKDIAYAFCEDLGQQLQHPKCTTFFMTPQQVYEKIEDMCEHAYEAAGRQGEIEFNEALYWEILALIKKRSPQLLESDHSIHKQVRDCTICQKQPGYHTHDEHLLCPDCHRMIAELQGEDAPSSSRIQCYYCHGIQDLVADMDIIYCPSCLKMIKEL